MKKSLVIAVTFVAVASANAADEGSFVATSVPKARIRQNGKIVIKNDSRAITAYRFFNNVQQSLFSLRSSPTLQKRSYGGVVFDSNARLDSRVPQYLSEVVTEAARKHGVDPRLLAAVASRESAWNPNAVSRVGACGLMQLMPATARFLGVSNIFDPRENVHGGARYLRTLLETFNGDLDLTLAAYNAGPGAVQKYNGVPPYRETQAYVKAVKANYERALNAR